MITNNKQHDNYEYNEDTIFKQHVNIDRGRLVGGADHSCEQSKDRNGSTVQMPLAGVGTWPAS